MLVKSNKEHVMMLSVAEGEPQMKIIPGVNEIPDETWAKIRPRLATKLVKNKGETRAALVELHATTKAGAKSPTGKTLKELTAAEAVAVVEKTLFAPLLEEWLQKESRDEVRLAIQNQLVEMKKRNKPKSKSKDDEDED